MNRFYKACVHPIVVVYLLAFFSSPLFAAIDVSVKPLAKEVIEQKKQIWNLEGKNTCDILSIVGSPEPGLFKAVREVASLVKKEPKAAFEKLLSTYAKCQKCLSEGFPKLYELLSFSTMRLDKDTLTFLTRVNDILLGESERDRQKYDGPVIWKANKGIQGYLLNGLLVDETYVDAAHDFLSKLNKKDVIFKELVMQSRVQRHVPVQSKIDISNSNGNAFLDYSPGDPLWEDFPKELKDFNIAQEMILSVVENLPEESKNDPKIIRQYVHKILLLFHDDVHHWNRNEQNYLIVQKEGLSSPARAQKMKEVLLMTPERLSLMYTNWARIEETAGEAYLLKFQKKLDELNPDHNYRLPALRYGNYHYNASAALHGLATEGLFNEIPGISSAVSAFQAKLAVIYKSKSAPLYRSTDLLHYGVYNYLKSHAPEMVAKFEKGKMTTEEVMGTSLISTPVFEDLLNNRDRKFETLARNLGVSIEDPKKVRALKTAILMEQLLWLQTARTVQQHRSGAKISELIDREVDNYLVRNANNH